MLFMRSTLVGNARSLTRIMDLARCTVTEIRVRDAALAVERSADQVIKFDNTKFLLNAIDFNYF